MAPTWKCNKVGNVRKYSPNFVLPVGVKFIKTLFSIKRVIFCRNRPLIFITASFDLLFPLVECIKWATSKEAEEQQRKREIGKEPKWETFESNCTFSTCTCLRAKKKKNKKGLSYFVEWKWRMGESQLERCVPCEFVHVWGDYVYLQSCSSAYENSSRFYTHTGRESDDASLSIDLKQTTPDLLPLRVTPEIRNHLTWNKEKVKKYTCPNRLSHSLSLKFRSVTSA